jgi:hypothetical protein
MLRHAVPRPDAHLLPARAASSTPHAADAPSSTTPTRLFFVAGTRDRTPPARSRELSRSGQAVNVGRNDLFERISKIEANRFEQAEAGKAMKGELARMVGEAGRAR